MKHRTRSLTHRIRRLTHRTRIHKPIVGPLSSSSLFELSLFSTFIFVFTALLMQFLLILHTALLLKIYSITFQYSLFSIDFLSESSSNWPEDQIYFIFGSGPLILSSVGLLLLFILKKIRIAGWKGRLFLTWLAFLMVNALPCGIVAGVFFYDSFGIAFHWLISSYIIRGLIALTVLLILIFFSRFWQRRFLKASYTSAFLDHGDHQKIFIKNVYFKPWIYGLMILMLFNLPFNNLYWPAFLLSLGFMAIPLFDRSTRTHRKPHIMKSDKKIFTNRYQILYILIVLALIWVADNFLINF